MKGKIILSIIIICIFALFITSKKTYTSYESLVDNEVDLKIATWKIKIAEQDIVSTNKDISLSNIEWESEHTNDDTVAPGSKGIVRINIDPTESQVAIDYSITYEDHTKNPDCILTVTSIYLENEKLEKISDNSYGGIITMDQIKEQNKKVLVIHVEWVNDENNNKTDSQIGLNESTPNYLNLVFNAKQYTGK